MPDENGFATPEERGDFVPDSDNPPPEASADADGKSAEGGGSVSPTGGSDASSTGGGGGADGVPTESAPAADPQSGVSTPSGAPEGADKPADTESDVGATGDVVVEGDAEGELKEADSGAEPKTPVEKKEDDPPKVPVQRVRKSRFDVKVSQLKAARERIAELEAEKAANATDQTSTIDALSTRLLEANQAVAAAVKDGSGDIAQLMLDAQTIQAAITEARIEEASSGTLKQTDAQTEFRRTLDEVEDALPMLQPGNPTYSQDDVDRVSELTQTFQRAGEGPAEAVLHAVALLYPEEVDATKETITKKVLPKSGGPVTGGRKTTDVAKNVDAAKRTPPPLSQMGDDSTKLGVTKDIDVTKLSEKEFDALPLETLRRLRGDTL